MKALIGSGGSTKGIQLAVATIEVLESGYKPDIVAGTSVYSIIALPLILGMYNEVLSECLDIESDEMFKVVPVKKGKITFRAGLRAFLGLIGIENKYSFGVQDTRHFTKKYITEEMFEAYKCNNALPDIWIMTVDFTTGLPVIYKAKSLSYSEYIEAVEKSAHIPVMTDAVGDEVDGGNWAHNPEWYLLEFGLIQPTELISIYVREYRFKIKRDCKWKNNIASYITRTMDVFNVALSSAGQSSAYWYCKANNIKHKQLFCPQVLDEMYDFDDAQLQDAVTLTKQSIVEQLTNFSI